MPIDVYPHRTDYPASKARDNSGIGAIVWLFVGIGATAAVALAVVVL